MAVLVVAEKLGRPSRLVEQPGRLLLMTRTQRSDGTAFPPENLRMNQVHQTELVHLVVE